MSNWDSLSMAQRADVMKLAIENGIYDLDTIRGAYNEFAKGGSIHIKPENRGKFTALKKRTGHSATWFKQHGTPAQKKMATFALNARHWKHEDGGELVTPQNYVAPQDATYVAPRPERIPIENGWEEAALGRTNQVYSNYEDAKDSNMSWVTAKGRNIMRWIKDNVMDVPAGVSNCTLSATQWVDPRNPINHASSIKENPGKYGYTAIDSVDAVPGNLFIARNPNNDSYHTMMISGFAGQDSTVNFDGNRYPVRKGEPLLTYSKGGHDTSHIRRNIPISVYRANNDGKTEEHFYRYNYPNEIFLPELVIKPQRR